MVFSKSNNSLDFFLMYFHFGRSFAALLVLTLTTQVCCGGDDYVIYSPRVTQGEAEVEMRGFNTRDGNPGIDRTGMFGAAVAYSPTTWWKTELYTGPFEYGPAAPGTHLAGWELENFFQLTEHNEYWADLGKASGCGHDWQI